MKIQQFTPFINRSADGPIGIANGNDSTSADVLHHLSATLTAFHRFKELEQTRLDPWEVSSLSVAEQALERAWLALSQLHADLQGLPRRA